MSNNNFFSKIKPNSARKISIILDYFDYWLKKNSSAKELYYIDLFCGPGVYDNGEKSTPILILERILKNRKIATKFNIVLNDKNKNYMQTLERAVISTENIFQLKSITFSNHEVDKITSLPNIQKAHAFVILDPWGYKGISSEQIKSLVKNKNIELVFLFSFNQLYRFLKFKGIDHHLLNLFSKKSLRKLRDKIDESQNKEIFVLQKLMDNMIVKNVNYLCYRFKFETQNKTSHFLVFLSQNAEAKNTLLNIFTNQNTASTNLNWNNFISKKQNSSCFVLYYMIKYTHKLIKRLKNYVIKYRMDRSNLESCNRMQ